MIHEHTHILKPNPMPPSHFPNTRLTFDHALAQHVRDCSPSRAMSFLHSIEQAILVVALFFAARQATAAALVGVGAVVAAFLKT